MDLESIYENALYNENEELSSRELATKARQVNLEEIDSNQMTSYSRLSDVERIFIKRMLERRKK
jgi:hypothetical protein